MRVKFHSALNHTVIKLSRLLLLGVSVETYHWTLKQMKHAKNIKINHLRR